MTPNCSPSAKSIRTALPAPAGRNATRPARRCAFAICRVRLIVIAEESRSQHDNRAKALKRLRQAFYLKLREAISTEGLSSISQRAELASVRSLSGKLEVGRRDERFWPAVGLILDVLEATEARVSETAAALGISTGHLIDFLETEPKVWEQANQQRQRFGHKPLKTGN